MPKISKRGELMPESPIRKLVPYAEQAKKNGNQVYHLNIGQPDIKSPDIAINAVKNIKREVFEYSHSAGLQSYREKISEYYLKLNLHITSEDIIVTNGASEAILFAINSCLDSDDEIIIPEPFYANYNGFAKSCNAIIKPIKTSIKTSFKLPEIQEFENKITKKTKAILICNPNNPTGYLYNKQELETLKKIVKKHNLFLFVDEVYREFCYDENNHYSILNFKDIQENVVVFDSVSKRYSMCGVRVGCLISKNKNIINTALKFAQARLSPPLLGQIASEAAVDVEEKYFTEVINTYQKRRNLLISELNKINGVFCPMPKGAFYCIAELPVKNAENFATWLLKDFSHNKKTIMIAPANGFYSDEKSGLNQVRIAYVLKEQDLKESIDILKLALQQYKD
ncbi:MAG: aspartate aminotransferase [Flavobacteriales bacterium]|nr:aspartate aminotransferase [Flavobacteriales bacterium]